MHLRTRRPHRCQKRLKRALGKWNWTGETEERLPYGAGLDPIHRQCAAARRFALRGDFVFSGCKVSWRHSGSFRLIAKRDRGCSVSETRHSVRHLFVPLPARCGQAEQQRRLAVGQENPDRLRKDGRQFPGAPRVWRGARCFAEEHPNSGPLRSSQLLHQDGR